MIQAVIVSDKMPKLVFLYYPGRLTHLIVALLSNKFRDLV